MSKIKKCKCGGFIGDVILNSKIEKICIKCKTYEIDIIAKARDFAQEVHRGQLDDDGVPYFCHVSNVADIIWFISRDENLTAAAYLHDTIEDTKTTYEDLLKEFGKDIADLVHEVTHEGKKDSKGYYFPRLKTQRGITLKFADRLSNISRMKNWSKKKKQHYLNKSKFWKSE